MMIATQSRNRTHFVFSSRFFLWLLIFFSLGLRFFRLGSTPFINDEPNLQLVLDHAFQIHRIPCVGLSGSQPIPYGPIPLWFYACVRMVSSNHMAIVLAPLLVQTLAILALYGLLASWVGSSIALLSILPLSTSPFLYFYSRLPWDNIFLIPSVVGCLICVTNLKKHNWPKSPKLWVVFGFFSAFTAGTHLMALPFLIALDVFILGNLNRNSKDSWIILKNQTNRNILKGLGLQALVFVLVMLPYVVRVGKAWRTLSRSSQGFHFDSLKLIIPVFLKFTSFLSIFEFNNYFLKGATISWTQSLVYPGTLLPLAAVLSWILRVSILIGPAIFLGHAYFTKKKFDFFSQLVFFSYGVLLFTDFVYIAKNQYNHPHYYHYLTWVSAVFLGFLIKSVQSLFFKRALLGLVVGVSSLNLYFIVSLGNFWEQNHGTRDLAYAVDASNQTLTVQRICADMKQASLQVASVDLSQVALLPVSVTYFFNHEPSCQGLGLSFSSQGRYQLHYLKDSVTDASLQLKIKAL